MDSLFQKCLERVDGCVQEVVNAWALVFPAQLEPEFKVVFDAACGYRTANDVANNQREFDSLTEEQATREKETREVFCKAYTAFLRKHPDVLNPRIRSEVGLA